MERRWVSAFDKQPVADAVRVTPAGIDGDAVADTVHHGGPDKAVLFYATSHYDGWRQSHPHLPWPDGAMGENLTVTGIRETDVCIGDRYAVGDEVVIEVSQPRAPCWKINRRWADGSLLKEVVRTGRTGWYGRVVTGGTMRRGDACELIARPNPRWNVHRCNEVYFRRDDDASDLRELPQLSPAWTEGLPTSA